MEADDKGVPFLAFKKEAGVFSDLRNDKGDVLLRNIKAFKFQPLKLAENTEALLGLEDGRALLAETRLGRGAIFTSGLAMDSAWTTLPLKGAFLALAQNMALSGGEALDALSTVTAGDKPLALVRGHDLIHIQTVAGSPLEWRGEPKDLPVFPRSGVYAVRTGTNLAHVSVRASAQEGRRAFLTRDRIPTLGGVSYTVRNFSDVDSLAAQARKTQVAMELFLPLLLLAMLCLALEGWLANPLPRKAQAVKQTTGVAATMARG